MYLLIRKSQGNFKSGLSLPHLYVPVAQATDILGNPSQGHSTLPAYGSKSILVSSGCHENIAQTM